MKKKTKLNKLNIVNTKDGGIEITREDLYRALFLDENAGNNNSTSPVGKPPWWAFWATKRAKVTNYDNCGDENPLTFSCDTSYDDKSKWQDFHDKCIH